MKASSGLEPISGPAPVFRHDPWCGRGLGKAIMAAQDTFVCPVREMISRRLQANNIPVLVIFNSLPHPPIHHSQCPGTV